MDGKLKGYKNHIVNERELEYYKKQSVITDPKEYAWMYKEIPDDISEIIKVVQKVTIHPEEAAQYNIRLSKKQKDEELLRAIPEMLREIKKNDARSLIYAREPAKRLVGICRDMSVLLVSILRYKNIPSRVRAGFANYFDSEIKYEDHWVAEYWDYASKCWKIAD